MYLFSFSHGLETLYLVFISLDVLIFFFIFYILQMLFLWVFTLEETMRSSYYWLLVFNRVI